MTSSGAACSSVWSAIGWDGDKSLTSASLHFDRMRRHSRRLGIDFPDDFMEQVNSLIEVVSTPNNRNDDPSQDPYLMVIRLTSEGTVSATGVVNRKWPLRPLSGISIDAPTWEGDIRGTKHGDYGPYQEARVIAENNGGDIGLLFENRCLIDGDRCAPLLLDSDGVAYHSPHDDGALDSVTLHLIKPYLEESGIPVRPARLTLGMIERSSEMIVCGSGMGVKALGTIDGRKIGKPHGPLFSISQEAWSKRVVSSKFSEAS